jgi:hypothetical protein
LLVFLQYGQSADAVRLGHGYDYASRRTWREDSVASAANADYDAHYAGLGQLTDAGLGQLTDADLGNLNQDKTTILGSPLIEEDFDLEPLGNWANYLIKSMGMTALDEDRTHNKANELTEIEESSTLVAHDAAGNMTKVPTPGRVALPACPAVWSRARPRRRFGAPQRREGRPRRAEPGTRNCRRGRVPLYAVNPFGSEGNKS